MGKTFTVGTRDAVAALSGLEAPWASIIGNHDLESAEFQSAAAVAMMLNALGRKKPGWVIKDEVLAIVGLENTYIRISVEMRSIVTRSSSAQHGNNGWR